MQIYYETNGMRINKYRHYVRTYDRFVSLNVKHAKKNVTKMHRKWLKAKPRRAKHDIQQKRWKLEDIKRRTKKENNDWNNPNKQYAMRKWTPLHTPSKNNDG